MGTELVLDWCRALRWPRNPFQPTLAGSSIAGLNEAREMLNLFLIKEKRAGYIIGEDGVGKSTILKWLDAQLRTQTTYLHCWIDGDAKPEPAQLCTPLRAPFAGFWGKHLGKPTPSSVLLEVKTRLKKPYIILIDNADNLPKTTIEWLATLLTNTNMKAVVTQKEFRNLFGSDELRITLTTPSTGQLREILAQRIQSVGGTDIWPFSDQNVSDIAIQSNHNPAAFLRLCEEKAMELAIQVSRGELSQVQQEAPVPNQKKKGFSIKVTNSKSSIQTSEQVVDEPVPIAHETIEFTPPEKPDTEVHVEEEEPETDDKHEKSKKDSHKDAHKRSGKHDKDEPPHRISINVLGGQEENPKEKHLRRDGVVLD